MKKQRIALYMNNDVKNFLNNIKKPKMLLMLANILLVFFLILLSNLGVLPFKSLGDFGFFVFLGLILALYRPGWGFLFFVGTIALENINLAPASIGIDIRPYQFFGGITALSILIRLSAKRLNFKTAELKWPDYSVGIIVIAGLASSLFADDRALGLKLSAILLTFGVLYLLARNYVQETGDLKKVAPFFLSSGIVVIFYGIWQNLRFGKGLQSFEAMPGRPNATFAEADWLGIYLVLLIASLCAIILDAHKTHQNSAPLISNSQFPRLSKPSTGGQAISQSQVAEQSLLRGRQITNPNPQIYKFYFLYFFLVLIFILLILTVSRSAWLGALGISIMYQVLCIKYFVWDNKNWKGFFRQLMLLASAGIASVAVVYVFNLTSFQIFNRAESTGTGLQKITISCWSQKCDSNGCVQREMPLIENIKSIAELEKYGCKHINLEDIEKEKAAGNMVYEIYRKDPNVDIRKEIYRKSWEQIKKHPLLGIGWGNIGKILGSDKRGAALNSSNIFLEVWLGSGIAGLLAFLSIWIYILFGALKKFLKEGEPAGMFILFGAVAVLIPNMFNAGLLLGIIWLFQGIAVSLNSNNADRN